MGFAFAAAGTADPIYLPVSRSQGFPYGEMEITFCSGEFYLFCTYRLAFHSHQNAVHLQFCFVSTDARALRGFGHFEIKFTRDEVK